MLSLAWDRRGPDWSGPHWFNISAPALVVRWRGTLRAHVWAWDCFNRRCADDIHYWGVGVLNVNGRHLLYAGHENVDVLFMRVWRS